VRLIGGGSGAFHQVVTSRIRSSGETHAEKPSRSPPKASGFQGGSVGIGSGMAGEQESEVLYGVRSTRHF
jgi:hypothetical protein